MREEHGLVDGTPISNPKVTGSNPGRVPFNFFTLNNYVRNITCSKTA